MSNEAVVYEAAMKCVSARRVNQYGVEFTQVTMQEGETTHMLNFEPQPPPSH